MDHANPWKRDGVQLRGAAQGLAGAGVAALARVVDERDGADVGALELAQVGEQRGDLGVLVDPMQPDEFVEFWPSCASKSRTCASSSATRASSSAILRSLASRGSQRHESIFAHACKIPGRP